MKWNISNILKIIESTRNRKTKPELDSGHGPVHPYMSLLGMQRMQGPDHSLPRPFIRVTLAESKLGGWAISPSKTKVTPHSPCRCFSTLLQPDWMGSTHRVTQGAWETRGTDSNMNLMLLAVTWVKILCLWPRCHMISMKLWQANLVALSKPRSQTHPSHWSPWAVIRTPAHYFENQ